MLLHKIKKYHFFIKRANAQSFASSAQSARGQHKKAQDKDNDTQQQLQALSEQSELQGEFDYDIAVIGGGSGGIACCQEAQRLGLRTILFDFVEASPRGSRWGLGGTCVNVGCIPKKLFHLAAAAAENLERARDFGFDIASIRDKFSTSTISNKIEASTEIKGHKDFVWSVLEQNVRTYISNMNLFYESLLAEIGVHYVNAFAGVIDAHTVAAADSRSTLQQYISEVRKKGELVPTPKVKTITAKFIVLATGTRPNYELSSNCKNLHKYAITSDDIFTLAQPPGKTLIIGGGYIALELAGVLGTLGYPVTVMTRDKWLRSFDQEMVAMIVRDLQKFQGVRLLTGYLPTQVDQKVLPLSEKPRLAITAQKVVSEDDQLQAFCEDFDTVIVAAGRSANLQGMGLEGMITLREGKVLGYGALDDGTANSPPPCEQTSVPSLFALGDLLHAQPELTSVAVRQGRLLAHRLSNKIKRKNNIVSQQSVKKESEIDWNCVPTTIFTPIEYSCIGLSEEKAHALHGKDNIVVYHSNFPIYEDALYEQYDYQTMQSLKRRAHAKVIAHAKSGSVLGLHYYALNSGEAMQGFSVAFATGHLTLDILLNRALGIHPVNAEELVNLTVAKPGNPERLGC